MKSLQDFLKSKTDYTKIPLVSKTSNDHFDLSVIIPVRGRTHFMEPCIRYFDEAIKKALYSVSITFVEHSYLPEYIRTDKNYLWIQADKDSAFNKCLSFNMGFLYGPSADYYLFHDLDLLPDDLFLRRLILSFPSMQAFKERRVLYMNDDLTKEIIDGKSQSAPLDINNKRITAGKLGAPGGSILVSKERFIDVGGYDDELFSGYSIEDQFFYNKLSEFEEVHHPDNIELVHMFHGEDRMMFDENQRLYLNEWDGSDRKERLNYMKSKSDHFSKFVKS